MAARALLAGARRATVVVAARAAARPGACVRAYTGPASPYRRQKDNLLTHHYNKLIGAERDPLSALAIKQRMVAEAVPLSVLTYSQLLDVCIKAGDLAQAQSVLEEMRVSRKCKPTAVHYTALIRAFAAAKKPDMQAAEALFAQMKDDGVPPTEHTYSALLSGAARAADVARAVALYRELTVAGLEANVVVQTQVIDAFGRAGRHAEAEEMLVLLLDSGHVPTVQTYTTMIGNLCATQHFDRAHALFKDMCRRGVAPDAVTYFVFVRGAQAAGNHALVKTLLADMSHWRVAVPEAMATFFSDAAKAAGGDAAPAAPSAAAVAAKPSKGPNA